MIAVMRIRPHPLLVIYLIIAVAAAFLFAAVDPIRSFEIETPEAISGVWYTSPLAAFELLAVLPQTSQNGNSLSSFRMISLRFFILFGICVILTVFSGSFLNGKIQANPLNKKFSILLKLRI
jgi:hypothetical protein